MLKFPEKFNIPVKRVIDVASKLFGIKEHHIVNKGKKLSSDINELRLYVRMQNVLALFRKILKQLKTSIKKSALKNKEIMLVETYNNLQLYFKKCF